MDLLTPIDNLEIEIERHRGMYLIRKKCLATATATATSDRKTGEGGRRKVGKGESLCAAPQG